MPNDFTRERKELPAEAREGRRPSLVSDYYGAATLRYYVDGGEKMGTMLVQWTRNDVQVRAAHIGLSLEVGEAGRVLERMFGAGSITIRDVERIIRAVARGE